MSSWLRESINVFLLIPPNPASWLLINPSSSSPSFRGIFSSPRTTPQSASFLPPPAFLPSVSFSSPSCLSFCQLFTFSSFSFFRQTLFFYQLRFLPPDSFLFLAALSSGRLFILDFTSHFPLPTSNSTSHFHGHFLFHISYFLIQLIIPLPFFFDFSFDYQY